MSALLDSVLDIERRIQIARSDAALIAEITAPNGKQLTAAPLPYFRVEANWPGGGFGFTLPFTDATAARAWGLMKAEGRSDAVVTAQPRKSPAQVAADKADGYRAYGSYGTCMLCGDRTKGTVCERHSGVRL